MRKAYALLLAVYAIFLASSFAETAGSVSAVQNILSLPLPAAHEKNDTVAFTAKNGAELEKGAIENGESVPSLIASINIGGRNMTVGSYLAPYKFVQYAKVAGFVIVPNGSALIDERETTYFSSSGKLKITLAANDASGVAILVPNGAVPLAVISQKNVEWSFTNEILYVKSLSPPMGNVTQIYFGRPLRNGFVEDTEKLETIGYENSKLLLAVRNAQEELNVAKTEESDAKANVTALNIQLIDVKKIVNTLQSDNGNMTVNIATLEKKSEGMAFIDYWALTLLAVLSIIAIYFSVRKVAK